MSGNILGYAFLRGLAHGLVPGSTCRANPHDLGTEPGQEWYAGWYLAHYRIPNTPAGYLTGRVYAHCALHYEEGWDYLMECVEQEAVLTLLADCEDVPSALAKVTQAYPWIGAGGAA